MASRLRCKLATIFDVVLEVASPPADNPEGSYVLWKYPDDFEDQKMLKSIAEFAFPCGVSEPSPPLPAEQNHFFAKQQRTSRTSSSDSEPTEAVQLFSFVFTNENGEYTFGYCRHTPKSNTCLCLLSGLPWTNLFYKLLNHFSFVMNNGTPEELEGLLIHAYHQDVPHPGEIFTTESSLGCNKFECHCPDHTKLPTIQDNRNLMEYYSVVSERHMIHIFASLLKERRVIFTSRKLSQLSSCVLAANMLIHPMHWQHIFIPVLPQHLVTYLSAPMPFLVGVPKSTLQKNMHELDLSEVVVLDIDEKTFYSPHPDFEELPHEVISVLKRNLRSSNHLLGDGFARSFLRATVALIGGYRRGLVCPVDDGKIRFDPDRFVAEQRPSLRAYLNGMRHLQIFEQFTTERLDALNSGDVVQDEFESECRCFEQRPVRTTGDLMREKGMEAFSGFQERVSKLAKEAPAAMGQPVSMKQLQKPIDAATSLMKDRVHSIKLRPLRPKSRDFKSYTVGDDLLEEYSKESHSSEIETAIDANQVMEEEATAGGASSSLITGELAEMLEKRSSVLVRLDEATKNQRNDSEFDPVKSSKSLTDLLQLDSLVTSNGHVTSEESSSYLTPSPLSPKSPLSTVKLHAQLRSCQSSNDLESSASVISPSKNRPKPAPVVISPSKNRPKPAPVVISNPNPLSPVAITNDLIEWSPKTPQSSGLVPVEMEFDPLLQKKTQRLVVTQDSPVKLRQITTKQNIDSIPLLGPPSHSVPISISNNNNTAMLLEDIFGPVVQTQSVIQRTASQTPATAVTELTNKWEKFE